MDALATTFVNTPEQIFSVLDRTAPAALVLDDRLSAGAYELLSALSHQSNGIPILAVEAPCPHTRASAAELASPDRDEARTAVALVEETIQRAGSLAAQLVVVRLGGVRGLDWARARERFLRGHLDEDAAEALAREREAAGGRALDGARRSLERLVRAAEAAGLVLCVANPRRYVELPTAREIEALLDDYRGAPLAPVFDVASAHLPDVMGFQPLAITLAAFGKTAPLAYVGDACGPIGALAPGRGIVDLEAVTGGLAKEARRVFRPWRGLLHDEVVESYAAFSRTG